MLLPPLEVGSFFASLSLPLVEGLADVGFLLFSGVGNGRLLATEPTYTQQVESAVLVKAPVSDEEGRNSQRAGLAIGSSPQNISHNRLLLELRSG